MNAYLSTPKFITILTDLTLDLIHQTNRDDFLQAELKKINHRLPAAVYIPFVNDSMRNYAILHIVADEAKIFQTKERAPLLLHFEAFRPEELMLLVAPEKPLKNKKGKGGGAFKTAGTATELEYENYRTSSWDSSSILAKEELNKLRSPLIARNTTSDVSNPYLVEKSKKVSKDRKKTITTKSMAAKDQEQIQQEIDALGFEGDTRKTAAEVMILNSKAAGNRQKRKEQQE